MFGDCVWAQLSSTHPINQQILNFCRLFNQPLFKAHLTLEYDLKEPFDKNKYTVDDFVRDGVPYKTELKKFYAIQQDYYMKNNPSQKLHISLAYKNLKPFNHREEDFLLYLKLDEVISKKDIEVHLWNCNSRNPEEWKLIK